MRNAIREFNTAGLASLHRESSRPKTVVPLFDRDRAEQLRALLQRSPRDFGHDTSIWTLRLAAQTCVSEGLTPYLVSIETIRQALRLLDISWQRAKHWITAPTRPMPKKTPPRPLDRVGDALRVDDWVHGRDLVVALCVAGAA